MGVVDICINHSSRARLWAIHVREVRVHMAKTAERQNNPKGKNSRTVGIPKMPQTTTIPQKAVEFPSLILEEERMSTIAEKTRRPERRRLVAMATSKSDSANFSSRLFSFSNKTEAVRMIKPASILETTLA